MTMHRRLATHALLLACALFAGCATTRSEIKLEGPAAAATPAPATGPTVLIRTVSDERVFEQAPKDPSTPSLGFEGALQASADVKARAVARKRGGFGAAMGDVLLENGQTVAGVMRENLASALQQAGYRVVTEPVAAPPALTVDVRIKQFWAWFRPGFWAITLSANIQTDLVVAGKPQSTPISVHVEDSRQIATDGAWMEVVRRALDAYRAAVASRLGSAPL